MVLLKSYFDTSIATLPLKSIVKSFSIVSSDNAPITVPITVTITVTIALTTYTLTNVKLPLNMNSF